MIPHPTPLPSPTTTEGFAVSAQRLQYDSLYTRRCIATAGRSADFSMASGPVPCQSQWNGMDSSLNNGTRAPVTKLQGQYHMPHGVPCGWNRDFEPSSVPPAIPTLPLSVSPALASTPSYPDMAQYDAYLSHVLDGSVAQDTYTSSPDGDSALSSSGFLPALADYDFHMDACTGPRLPMGQHDAQMSHVLDGIVQDISASSPDGDNPLSSSGFLRAFANYDFHFDPCQPPIAQCDARMSHVLPVDDSVVQDPSASSLDGATALSASGLLHDFANYDFSFDARADPQSSIALTHTTLRPVQSTALPSVEWTCGPDHQTRILACQWVTNGAPCGKPIMGDRRNVVEHMQHSHGIKPGEEKFRQTCLWEGCRKILNKESLARHILTVHLKEKVYCAECGLYFAREDSLKRHLKGGQHKGSCDKNSAKQSSRSRAGSR